MPDATPQSAVVVPPPAVATAPGTPAIPLVMPEPVKEDEAARLIKATQARYPNHKDVSVHGAEIRSISPLGQLHITNPDQARRWADEDAKAVKK